MKLGLGMINILCIVPLLLIIHFANFPRNWKKRKTIFGIKNRDEFKTGETEKKVDEIVRENRRISMWITIIAILLAVGFLLIPNMTAMLIVYTVYIMLTIVICMLPYVKGNTELKSLKKELGIEAVSVRAADLKSINASHALNLPMLLLPNIIAGICFLFGLLYDFKIISIPSLKAQGSFIITMISATFFFMGILFVFLAKLMDSIRNEVISQESDVNANYNRAKKKLWSDLWIRISWLNTGTIILIIASYLINGADSLMITTCLIWTIGFFVVLALYAKNTISLNNYYKYENSIDDGDDNWIYGIFYYNPRDSRLNIERRDGMGVTINMAHPIGKLISIIVVLVILGSLASVMWAGLLENTEIDVKYENGKVICHQLRDEYIISKDDIQEVTCEDNLNELKVIRIAGVSMDKLLKGRFTVNSEEKARFFLDPRVNTYIHIKTGEINYYINENSEEETLEIYEALIKDL